MGRTADRIAPCLVLGFVLAAAATVAAGFLAHAADEPPPPNVAQATLENLAALEPNRADEPVAGEFSLDRAVQFLDAAAQTLSQDGPLRELIWVAWEKRRTAD